MCVCVCVCVCARDVCERGHADFLLLSQYLINLRAPTAEPKKKGKKGKAAKKDDAGDDAAFDAALDEFKEVERGAYLVPAVTK